MMTATVTASGLALRRRSRAGVGVREFGFAAAAQPRLHQPVDAVEPVKDAGKLDFGRPRLRREFPQGAHHAARVAASVVGEHPYQPERFGFRGADVLFEAGGRPRPDSTPINSEERRGGNACGSTMRSRGAPSLFK